jgi:hypothetical protein
MRDVNRERALANAGHAHDRRDHGSIAAMVSGQPFRFLRATHPVQRFRGEGIRLGAVWAAVCRGDTERGIAPQNLTVNLTEFRTRVDARSRETLADLSCGPKRIGLATQSVQRDYQYPSDLLIKRVSRRKFPQLPENEPLPSQVQVEANAELNGLMALIIESLSSRRHPFSG